MIPFNRDVKVVELAGVGFTYGEGEALRNVTIDIHEREFVSVVGPNGSGKSTLLKIILGLLTPSKGTVRVLGQTPERARARIGYMPQHANLDPHFPARVLDVVLMGRIRPDKFLGFHLAADRDAAMESLEKVGMAELARRPFSDLSGGQRQRVLIARAFAANPAILIMDEPTAGLDAWAESNLYDLLAELNREKTIILVSHDIGVVSTKVHSVVCVKCDAEIHPTSELTGEMINRLYGGPMSMVRHDHRCGAQGHKCSPS